MRPDAQVVVTDLDGCLLDAATYEWDAARPALDALKRRGIPLVLCSSKTRAEMEPLHAALGLDAPFVYENGGGIVIPPGAWWSRAARRDGGPLLVRLGVPLRDLGRALMDIAKEAGARLRGFSRLSQREASDLTGLDGAELERARQREHDEPFVLESGSEDDVRQAAERRGLRITSGGRFHHLTGAVGQGQGRAPGAVAARGRPRRSASATPRTTSACCASSTGRSWSRAPTGASTRRWTRRFRTPTARPCPGPKAGTGRCCWPWRGSGADRARGLGVSPPLEARVEERLRRDRHGRPPGRDPELQQRQDDRPRRARGRQPVSPSTSRIGAR